MKRIILNISFSIVVIVAFGFMSGCNSINVIVGSGYAVTQARHVKDFTSIDVEKAYNVVLMQGDSSSVTVVADSNFLPLIKTQVDDGQLKITNDGSFASTKLLKVLVTFKKLDEIYTNGFVNLTADSNALRFEDLKIKLNGATNLSMKLQVKKLAVKTSGASKISLSGICDKQKVDISGAGSYNAYGLISNEANVDISGAGLAELNVTGKLFANCSGASIIRYKGEPAEKHFNSSGASSIKPAE